MSINLTDLPTSQALIPGNINLPAASRDHIGASVDVVCDGQAWYVTYRPGPGVSVIKDSSSSSRMAGDMYLRRACDLDLCRRLCLACHTDLAVPQYVCDCSSILHGEKSKRSRSERIRDWSVLCRAYIGRVDAYNSGRSSRDMVNGLQAMVLIVVDGCLLLDVECPPLCQGMNISGLGTRSDIEGVRLSICAELTACCRIGDGLLKIGLQETQNEDIPALQLELHDLRAAFEGFMAGQASFSAMQHRETSVAKERAEKDQASAGGKKLQL